MTQTPLPDGALRVAARLAQLGHPLDLVMLPVTGAPVAEVA